MGREEPSQEVLLGCTEGGGEGGPPGGLARAMPAAGHSILQPVSLHPLLTRTLPSYPPPHHPARRAPPLAVQQAASRMVLVKVRRIRTHRENTSLSQVSSSLLLP